jgi:flagellar hook-basal body complex protein FliE
MQIAITSATSLAGAAASAGSTPQSGAKAPFADLLSNAMKELGGLEQNATRTVSGLLGGDGTDIHAAMIATEKADIAFEMALSFRNKAVGAYQQLMGTQF